MKDLAVQLFQSAGIDYVPALSSFGVIAQLILGGIGEKCMTHSGVNILHFPDFDRTFSEWRV